MYKWDTVVPEMNEADATAQQIIKSIYHFSASLCKKGKARSTIRAIKDKNGLKAWRDLIKDYEPQTPTTSFRS